MKGRVTAVVALLTSAAACAGTSDTTEDLASQASAVTKGTFPNEKDVGNTGGKAATYSTMGDLDLTNEFHSAQGRNGRSCGSCHTPDGGWSVTPQQIEQLFWETNGTDPIFLPLDANHPNADVSTRDARYASYSMLRKGLFRRGGAPPATREFDIVAATDPYGYGSADPQRFSVFRRPLATANFHLATNVGWDDANTRSGQTVPAGLFAQADNNVRTGQEGDPPTKATVDAIVAYESALSFAQSKVPGAGALDEHGGRGGPRLLSSQPLVAGRFDLYDAWMNDGNPHRRSIARGQEIFNTKARANGGGTCLSCHNAQNNGSNVSGRTFDVGASDERWASVDDLPVYTVQNRETGEVIRTTDPGKANRSGTWAEMNHFKVPSLRGLTARAPFFHNGVAKDLHEVVAFYEESLGFDFTPQEEADLVNFMNAL